jgi:signal transduction histidine kinase
MDPRAPQTVIGDRTRVCQVLTNLVDNALKFTQDGRVHVHVGPLDDGSEVPERGVQVTVADTGIGIGETDQASIFDSFSQVDGSATRHYQGTGLGLAIGKALTELMDGTIAVHSELGVGSTFTVRLPLPATDAPQQMAAPRARLTA